MSESLLTCDHDECLPTRCVIRAGFEQWAKSRKTALDLLRYTPTGNYLYPYTQLAWESWQESRKQLTSDGGDYWLLRSLAETVIALNIACQRSGVECAQSSDCITEWCPQCAAKAWLEQEKKNEQLTERKAE